MGIIYLLQSPSRNIYIGQTITTLKQRWREHIYDAYDSKKNHCVALNNAIRKYKPENFFQAVLLICNDNMLDEYEAKFINMYFSTDPKFGYNIKEGGSSSKHSESTKIKISNSLKGRVVKESTKKKLSLTKKQNKSLPMYIIEYKNNQKVIGYRVCNHPMGSERKFTDMSLTLEEKYQKALDHLNYLNDLKVPKVPIKPKTHDLPKYFQRYKDGFCVKVPGSKTKYFVANSMSQEEKYSKAMKYYKSII